MPSPNQENESLSESTPSQNEIGSSELSVTNTEPDTPKLQPITPNGKPESDGAVKSSPAQPAMYLFVNKSLGMSIGKAMAQAAHAAVESYRGSKPEMIELWNLGKHYKKLVMEARDTQHLQTIAAYLQDRGFGTFFIIDEGLNEIAPHSFTALGVEIVDKSDPHTAATFSTFQLYRDKVRVTLEIDK